MRIVFLLMMMFSEIAIADEFVQPKRGAKPTAYDSNGNAIYKLIDLESRFQNGSPSPIVYKGTKSIEGEFPEVGFLGFCTATAVGPRVIYTAAHCVNNGQKVNWKMRKNQVSYPATCQKHPQYNDNTVFNDYAFCLLDGKLPDDTIFASFNIKGGPSDGAEALLNGFGAPNLGTHFWGKAVVDNTRAQDIVTCGPANLGGGDSGGSFFKWTTDRNSPEKHIIDGTNSRAGGGCSYFNSTSHPNFIAWAKPFADDRGLTICGVNKDCLGPPVDPNKCLEEKSFVSWVKKELGIAESQLALCLSKP